VFAQLAGIDPEGRCASQGLLGQEVEGFTIFHLGNRDRAGRGTGAGVHAPKTQGDFRIVKDGQAAIAEIEVGDNLPCPGIEILDSLVTIMAVIGQPLGHQPVRNPGQTKGYGAALTGEGYGQQPQIGLENITVEVRTIAIGVDVQGAPAWLAPLCETARAGAGKRRRDLTGFPCGGRQGVGMVFVRLAREGGDDPDIVIAKRWQGEVPGGFIAAGQGDGFRNQGVRAPEILAASTARARVGLDMGSAQAAGSPSQRLMASITDWRRLPTSRAAAWAAARPRRSLRRALRAWMRSPLSEGASLGRSPDLGSDTASRPEARAAAQVPTEISMVVGFDEAQDFGLGGD